VWLLLWWDGWGERGNHRMSRDWWTFRMYAGNEDLQGCKSRRAEITLAVLREFARRANGGRGNVRSRSLRGT
jgi:hypothetical protein